MKTVGTIKELNFDEYQWDGKTIKSLCVVIDRNKEYNGLMEIKIGEKKIKEFEGLLKIGDIYEFDIDVYSKWSEKSKRFFNNIKLIDVKVLNELGINGQ